jgi:hypothetical protein
LPYRRKQQLGATSEASVGISTTLVALFDAANDAAPNSTEQLKQTRMCRAAALRIDPLEPLGAGAFDPQGVAFGGTTGPPGRSRGSLELAAFLLIYIK